MRRVVAALWALVKKYPVRAQALIVASIAAGTAFGLGWTGGQVGAITGLTAAALAFFTESQVTSVSNPVLPQGTDVTVTTPPGQADRTTTL
ncbi:MAG TPA: hypothetical protein VGQ64_01850 [Candidatus Limnocylindrales bacterium]|jgi:hypothetical protein|nr:hypothetical protein [Candidatus Limnocylindrales bacterium]